jgi:lipoate-protein ligase A
LARLGVHASESPRRARATGPDGAACFAEPNVGELMVEGRKLVGSAQRRDERALLQHGSILLDDDQPMIATIRGLPPPPTTAATLNAILSRSVRYAEVRDALVAALRAALEPGDVGQLDPQELTAAVAVHRLRYASDEWTFRR